MKWTKTSKHFVIKETLSAERKWLAFVGNFQLLKCEKSQTKPLNFMHFYHVVSFFRFFLLPLSYIPSCNRQSSVCERGKLIHTWKKSAGNLIYRQTSSTFFQRMHAFWLFFARKMQLLSVFYTKISKWLDAKHFESIEFKEEKKTVFLFRFYFR